MSQPSAAYLWNGRGAWLRSGDTPSLPLSTGRHGDFANSADYADPATINGGTDSNALASGESQTNDLPGCRDSSGDFFSFLVATGASKA
jgi:hypothetical protein